MEFIDIIIISLVFSLGFLSAGLLSFNVLNQVDTPFSFRGSLNNGNAPFDFVKEKQIKIYDDRVVIYINDASLSKYSATGSMKPIFDKGANGIRIVPESENDIHVGDLISFKEGDKLIIHRVIDKGIDVNGTYFITKGDNNRVNDNKVRFKNIKYVTIGVIW